MLLAEIPSCDHADTRQSSGGLEMLFDDQKRVSIELPTAEAEGKPTLAFLIGYLCKNVMKDTRKELFVLDDHMCVLLCPLPPIFSTCVSMPLKNFHPVSAPHLRGVCSHFPTSGRPGLAQGDEGEPRLVSCSQALIASDLCLWLT